MILVDANLLVYGLNVESPQHERARGWLEDRLNGPLGVALPWPVLQAFVRIISNPRVLPNPMPPARAWAQVEEWLELDATFTPEPTQRHREILARLMPYVTRSELMPDAHLAALAMEYGLVLCSADTDFHRFPGLAWKNPLVEG